MNRILKSDFGNCKESGCEFGPSSVSLLTSQPASWPVARHFQTVWENKWNTRSKGHWEIYLWADIWRQQEKSGKYSIADSFNEIYFFANTRISASSVVKTPVIWMASNIVLFCKMVLGENVYRSAMVLCLNLICFGYVTKLKTLDMHPLGLVMCFGCRIELKMMCTKMFIEKVRFFSLDPWVTLSAIFLCAAWIN